MRLDRVDDSGSLFVSPAVDEGAEGTPLQERGIDTVIDLDGGARR
jgi:hypothetical protein